MKRTAVALLVNMLLSCGVLASDFSSCADTLDRLKRVTRDATDAAEDAKSKASSLEYCRQRSSGEYISTDSCFNDKSNLGSAKRTLSGELDTLSRRYKDAQEACEIEGPSLSPMQKTGDPYCDVYRRYLGRLPVAELMKICAQKMPEEECNKCMSFRPTVPGTLPSKSRK